MDTSIDRLKLIAVGKFLRCLDEGIKKARSLDPNQRAEVYNRVYEQIHNALSKDEADRIGF